MEELELDNSSLIEKLTDKYGSLVIKPNTWSTPTKLKERISNSKIKSIYIGENCNLGEFIKSIVQYEGANYGRTTIFGYLPNLQEVVVSLNNRINWYETFHVLNEKKELRIILKYDSLDEIMKIFEDGPPSGPYKEKEWEWPQIKNYMWQNSTIYNPFAQRCRIILNGPPLSSEKKEKITRKFQELGLKIEFSHKKVIPYHEQIHSNNPTIEEHLKIINNIIEELPNIIRTKVIERIKEVLDRYEQKTEEETPDLKTILSNKNNIQLTIAPNINSKTEAITEIIEIKTELLQMTSELKIAQEIEKLTDAINSNDTKEYTTIIQKKLRKIKELLDKITNENIKSLVIKSIEKTFKKNLDNIYSKIDAFITKKKDTPYKEITTEKILDNIIENINRALKYNDIINAIYKSKIDNYNKNVDDIINTILNTKYIFNKIPNEEEKKKLLDRLYIELTRISILEIEPAIKNNDYSDETYQKIEMMIRKIIQKKLQESKKIPIKIEKEESKLKTYTKEEYESKIYTMTYQSLIKDIYNIIEQNNIDKENKETALIAIDDYISIFKKSKMDISDYKKLISSLTDLKIGLNAYVKNKRSH